MLILVRFRESGDIGQSSQLEGGLEERCVQVNANSHPITEIFHGFIFHCRPDRSPLLRLKSLRNQVKNRHTSVNQVKNRPSATPKNNNLPTPTKATNAKTLFKPNNLFSQATKQSFDRTSGSASYPAIFIIRQI